jgi:hypothetical protein
MAHFHAADEWQVKWMSISYGMDGHGSILDSDMFFSSPQRRDRL